MSVDVFNANGIVTLLTDFGLSDGYAGSVKGVLLGRNPSLRVIDISHTVAPFSIVSAAYVMHTYCRDFPKGTVHVAVIDPGVGSSRRALAVQCDGHFFVAPDNGILTMVLGPSRPYRAWEITNARPPRDSVSATFHGRDVFAPAAAHLASGGDPADLGPETGDILHLEESAPEIASGRITGQVIHVDHFGNLITCIRGELVRDRDPGTILVKAGNYTIVGMSRTYADKEPGQLVSYIGSSGLVEIAIVKGSAAQTIKTPHGRTVEIVFREKRDRA